MRRMDRMTVRAFPRPRRRSGVESESTPHALAWASASGRTVVAEDGADSHVPALLVTAASISARVPASTVLIGADIGPDGDRLA